LEEADNRPENADQIPGDDGVQVDRKGLILVIETDVPIRQLLAGWLREAGYDVITGPADGGPTGAETWVPALVILNVPHPRDASALIRALETKHAAPILVVSARLQRGIARSADAARRFGVAAVLPKPFTRTELLESVAKALRAQDASPG
jgi:DNA-binding response OmpR family regulator